MYLCTAITQGSECSAVGSALRSGRRGRAFESPHSDRKGSHFGPLFYFLWALTRQIMKAVMPIAIITSSANMKRGFVPNVSVTIVDDSMVSAMLEFNMWSPNSRRPLASALKKRFRAIAAIPYAARQTIRLMTG